MPEHVKGKVKFEISEISTYKILIEKCKTVSPDFIEMAALASALHSFYNGIEKIFVIIAKDFDKSLPNGFKWHNSLLDQMKNSNKFRKEIINENDFYTLRKYLLFRHFFRHSYSWRLKWDEFSKLVFNLENVWLNIKPKLLEFFKR